MFQALYIRAIFEFCKIGPWQHLKEPFMELTDQNKFKRNCYIKISYFNINFLILCFKPNWIFCLKIHDFQLVFFLFFSQTCEFGTKFCLKKLKRINKISGFISSNFRGHGVIFIKTIYFHRNCKNSKINKHIVIPFSEIYSTMISSLDELKKLERKSTKILSKVLQLSRNRCFGLFCSSWPDAREFARHRPLIP